MRAARTVFARDGYSRASIDVIAAAADVSTRTIYNHFESKEQLFATVLEASATEVAEGVIAGIEQSLVGALDVESRLLAIGLALAGQTTNHAEHFAMVTQISPETPHFPADVLTAWKEAGPRRVRREVERQLEALADEGLIDIPDPTRATHHFIGLVTSEVHNRSFGSTPPTDDQTTEMVAAGVRAYLHGYATR